jgi:hypothetical protein
MKVFEWHRYITVSDKVPYLVGESFVCTPVGSLNTFKLVVLGWTLRAENIMEWGLVKPSDMKEGDRYYYTNDFSATWFDTAEEAMKDAEDWYGIAYLVGFFGSNKIDG